MEYNIVRQGKQTYYGLCPVNGIKGTLRNLKRHKEAFIMAKAIAARRKGDEYQARVFWLKLLDLRTSDYVKSVTLESDLASFVDDVVVFYSEPIKDRTTGKREIVCDLFQCKYHVTQHGAFTHENLINPKFINNQNSMLKRLYDAYVKLSKELPPDAFRLYIFSNWHWVHQDALAQHLHEETIRSTFYENGPRSAAGQARLKLASHLSVTQEELRAFLDTVRFTLGKNLADLASEMEPRLKLAGLQPIDPTVTHIPYDSLAWELFAQERNSFDKAGFDQMIREEKLITPPATKHSEISIQSFAQFARRPTDLQVARLDLLPLFDERFPIRDACWKNEIPEEISAFMLDEKLMDVPQPIHIFFDCHLSIAFFAGHLVSPKHRIQTIPTQKNGSHYTLWEQSAPDTNADLWTFQNVGKIDEEVILEISVTHHIQKQMQVYLSAEGYSELPQIRVAPMGGIGPTAVVGGTHAWQLGYQLAEHLREILPETCRTVHFFFAGPVALSYILGHTLRHIAPHIQLYEYDFEGQRGDRTYYPSLCITY